MRNRARPRNIFQEKSPSGGRRSVAGVNSLPVSTVRRREIKRVADCNRERSSSPVLKRKFALTEDYANNNISDMIRQTSPIRNKNIDGIEGRTMHSPFGNNGENKSFGNDSLLNESFFGALDDVERANLGGNSPKFNDSLNNVFEDSFSVNDVIFNHSMHSTPKRDPVLCKESSKPVPSVAVAVKPSTEIIKINENPGGSRSKNPNKKTAKKGKKKGNFKLAYTNKKHAQLLSDSGTNELSREDLSALSEEDKLLLSSWGLPESTLSKYRFKGVTTLFPWQLECLSNAKVFEGRNLVYSAPTSAGKTLVSEILMLKRVLELGKKAIMILPFVSVAREKMYSLQELFGDAGVKVEGFMGSYNPPGGFKSVDIAICTIEKANSLINRLLTEGNLSQLGTVVVDELHLVGDPHRGYLLELLLTKIKFMSGKKELRATQTNDDVDGTPKSTAINIQIIGMSATLPNLPLLATWLDAELVTTDYRPVPLIERLKIGDKIYDSSLREVRPIHQESLKLEIQNDPEGVIYLSLETVLNGHSVLIFCPTRAWCEKLAEQIAREFFSLGKPNSTKYPEIGKQLRDQLNSERIQQVLQQLNQCPAGKDEMLATTAGFGVGFHHAGLTFDERDILESAFKRGALRVIVATSTLSAGVNLPARRVIISSPVFNGAPLDALTYKQMSGRAGRKGVDTEGESILICARENHDIGTKLIQSALPSVTSALLSQSGYLTSSMKRALLEVVASGITKSAKEVHQYTKSTLLAIGGDSQEELPASQSGGSIIEECLEFLVENEFIKLVKYEDNDKSDEYVATQLGSACLSSSLSPDEGILVFKELLRARQCFVLANELHTIYQVTPIYLSDQWRNVDWNQYLHLYASLNPEELRVAQLVGVEERFILSALMSTVSWKNPAQRAKLSIHQRFYTALALNDLVNEMPIAKVTEKYGVTKGVVQNLQQSASTFAGMVTTFCSRLGWGNFELLLCQFQERLQFGVQRELCDLVRLSLVNGQRARILYNAGIQTVADLASCDPAQVEQVFHRAGPFISNVHGESGSGTMYVLGKNEALSESEASKLIVEEARHFLQSELGLKTIEFGKGNKSPPYLNASLSNRIELPKENLDVRNNSLENIQPSCINSNQVVKRNNDYQNALAEELMEIENDLDDDIPAAENEDIFLNGQNYENAPKNEAPDSDTSETASELFSDKSADLFENSGPVLDRSEHNSSCLQSDIDELGPTQKEHVEHDICLMDVSFSSFHLSDSAPEENRKLTPKDSQPMFSSSSSAIFENSDHSPCIESGGNLKALITMRSDYNKSSSSDLFDDDMEPDQLCTVLISHGRTIKLQNVCSLEALPAQLFVTENPVSVGIRVKVPKKAKVKKGGIGARVMGRESFRPTNDATYQFSIALYNGGDTIWICEWASKNELVPYQVAQLDGVFHRLAEVSCPVIMIDAKMKIKNLVKYFGHQVLQSISLLDCIWDPKIAEWLCQGEEVDLEEGENIWINLQKLIDLYLDDEDKKVEEMLWPSEAKECYMSAIFMTHLKGKLEASMLWSHFKEIETSCLLPIVLMEINGFAFDAAEFERLKQVLKMQAALLELKAFQIVGRHFNFSSSKDVHRVLFKDLKLCPPRKTRGTGKEVLSKLDHLVASIIIEWRKVHHALQLVLPFSQAQNPKTGRIHGSYSHFTVTGRILMAEPSLQFIPRDFDIKITFSKAEIESLRSNVSIVGPKITSLLTLVEDGLRLEGENLNRKLSSPLSIENLASVSMRNAFCASSNDYILIAADYSQLELRVLALLSKDSNLTYTLNSGCDVFKSIASTWKKIPSIEVGNDLRQEAKAIVYAIIYGMGKTSLGEKMNVSEDKAAEYIDQFMKTYPGVRKFIHTTKKICKEKGYVETLFGRRRYLPNINSAENILRAQAERQAVNYRVQGSASELVKKAMIRVQMRMDLLIKSQSFANSKLSISATPRRVQIAKTTPEISSCGLVLNLHDELIFEVRKDILSDIVAIIREAMEKPYSLPVLLPVNIKVGRSWGNLIPYENYTSVSII